MPVYKPPQTFFKAQFHFKTQKQRFSDDLKVKSAAGGDDHAVCVDELVISENFVNRLFTFCELIVYKKNLQYNNEDQLLS